MARLGNEQSTSMSRVSALTRSATARGDGHRFAAFIGTRSSRNANCRRTSSQNGSPGCAAAGRPASIGGTTPPTARACRNRRREVSTVIGGLLGGPVVGGWS